MTHARLERDVEIAYRSFHNVTAKKGAPLIAVTGGDRVYFALDPKNVETTSDRNPGSIWKFDTAHFYIYVPDDAVEKLDPTEEMDVSALAMKP